MRSSPRTLAADQQGMRNGSAGKVSALDVAQVRTSVDSARASLAHYQRQVPRPRTT
ncbi:hypothetical protein [Pseudomonas fluorescens]|uniref:hypothetical protein n=1 Tax=Pseudomonas fluorescens TaxID=294 RepID=UPI0013140D7D|nr:hypothetical protein [Pseudomonas fluorescens]